MTQEDSKRVDEILIDFALNDRRADNDRLDYEKNKQQAKQALYELLVEEMPLPYFEDVKRIDHQEAMAWNRCRQSMLTKLKELFR